MREIKFRAWDLEKKEWIGDSGTTFTSEEPTDGQVALSLTGHLRVFSTHCYDPDKDENGLITSEALKEQIHSVSNSEYESTHPCNTKPSYKRQYELMQFTGFKDINGVEVYEGDVLQTVGQSEHDPEVDPMVVVFEDGGFWADNNGIWDLAVYTRKPDGKLDKPTDQLEDLEVIGNIYENPELVR